ncbi:methyltransferase [Methanoculleus taiwanensis]|uniref:Methyltransferase n=1 Tax=Methanoculleus taiwanensis TaxID=1550565 RepID=A0A498H1Q5_9EURY|nr:class I SAM-dependent methyltransferase [Methanoculleus taiwanensis]RXE55970.1 methyltransferase [Methanoculleus taiwanensis]
MSEQEVIATLKHLAARSASFRLSEVRQCLADERSLPDLAAAIEPALQGLDLTIRPRGEDYELARMPPPGPLTPTGGGRKRQEAFFRSPAVPESTQQLIEAYIEKKTGKAWDDPTVLERMRSTILAQKSRYWREQAGRYQKGYQVLGYLGYHAPVYLVQFEHILWQLIEDGLVKERMRILDVGSGPGVVPLAIIDLLDRLGQGSARIFAIDRSEENLEAYNALVPPAAAPGGRVTVEKPLLADLQALPKGAVPGKIDLMVFSNVLNELRQISVKERAELVLSLADRLADDGTIVIVEPADLANATTMRETVLELAKSDLAIYRPCSFIWGTHCNPSRCWTFEQKIDIRPTRLMKGLAEGSEGYRFVNTDIKYSSATIRKDRQARCDYRVPAGAKAARFSQLQRHRNRRINVVAAVMSGNLGDADSKVYKLCDGTPANPVYAIVPRYLKGENRYILQNTPYGDIVRISGVVVRYNREHDAYNLVIQPDTTIERVSPGTSPADS